MENSSVLYVIGAGSVGGHILSNPDLYCLHKYKSVFVIDDNPEKLDKNCYGFTVIGNVDHLIDVNIASDVIIGVAFPKLKETIRERIELNKNLNFPNMVAKSAWISNNVNLGMGNIIYPNTSINYETTINSFVIINMNCAIGHHCEIGDFSSLAPGVNLGGNTKIGKCVDFGIGSSTIQGIQVGDNCIVGGQAMVINTFDRDLKIAGIPARSIMNKK
jgi:sugar O-acyltransferase (sialic acid O-acetyltransferase NeuD family)